MDREGWGAVYKARQKSLDRFVALKVIKPEAASDPAFRERFTREARALARLNHPNIVSVYDFGQVDGMFFFLMEFVDGTSLRHLLDAKSLKPEEALLLVPQICDALQYAHDQRIVHRDIKPENILVDRQGRVRIADFGLAKLLHHPAADFTLTGTFQIVGTPRYMAPEQLEGKGSVDHRADIFSLGVVLYEMLTGELPLGRFDLPSEKGQLDARLDQVVLRALDKEPNRRYQQASDVKTDVEQVARHPASTTPTHPSSQSKQFPRREHPGGEEHYEQKIGNLVFGLIIAALVCLFLPWGTVTIHVFNVESPLQATAWGYHFWLPTLTACLAFALLIRNLLTVFNEQPLNVDRAFLAMATGIGLGIAALFVIMFEPITNHEEMYVTVLRQEGHRYLGSSPMSKVMGMDRLGSVDFRTEATWGC